MSFQGHSLGFSQKVSTIFPHPQISLTKQCRPYWIKVLKNFNRTLQTATKYNAQNEAPMWHILLRLSNADRAYLVRFQDREELILVRVSSTHLYSLFSPFGSIYSKHERICLSLSLEGFARSCSCSAILVARFLLHLALFVFKAY